MDTLTHITLSTIYSNDMQRWREFKELDDLRFHASDVPDEAYLLTHPCVSATTLVVPNVPYSHAALACRGFCAVNKELDWAAGAATVDKISLSTYKH